MRRTDVVIVGAGPYGLSIAAHLARSNVPFRIFGKPMETWLTAMPRGMHLKSDGFASSLSDPESSLTLGQYCRQNKLPYAHTGLPVPLDTFSKYGLAFQQKFVPMLEQKLVSAIRRSSTGFTVELEDGEVLEARRVVVATGVSNFSHLPTFLQGLPSTFVSHSSEHADLAKFRRKNVVVVGRGASAIDIAVLLQESGANVRLVARKRTLGLNNPPSLKQRVLLPQTGLGPSWKSWFFANCAAIFHRLPERRRLKWVQSHLGPAGCWFMADRIARVPQLLGNTPVSATVVGNHVLLELVKDGSHQTIKADHIVAATGYRPSLDRLRFIEPGLRASIQSAADTPVLSPNFESSVSGLYFVGPVAANSFGPLMRFAFGSDYAARRLSRHLIQAPGWRDPYAVDDPRSSDWDLGKVTAAADASRH